MLLIDDCDLCSPGKDLFPLSPNALSFKPTLYLMTVFKSTSCF